MRIRLLLLLALRRLRLHFRAFTTASHTSGPTYRRLPLETLQHLGPHEVETKPELLCFNAPRCLRSIAYGHLFICACVAISIHLLPLQCSRASCTSPPQRWKRRRALMRRLRI